VADPTWIDLVLSRAAELRAAGVLSIGPESATFAPAEPEQLKGDEIKNDATESGLDALHDPATYAGGFVPGFTIEKYKDVEDL
jgi:hypothetical protein